MNKKHFIALIIIILIGFTSILLISGLFVSRSIDHAIKTLKEDMLSTAIHTGSTIKTLKFTSMNEISSTEIDTWLQTYGKTQEGTFIHVVTFDGHVQWSSIDTITDNDRVLS